MCLLYCCTYHYNRFWNEVRKEIEIEERNSTEVTHIEGIVIAPEGIEVYNPALM